jgi:hypothetical protein
MERYSVLWKKFNESEFEHDDASNILKEEKDRLVSVVLSDLKKHGWLTVKLHPDDSRKRIYKLKNPEEAITSIEST